MCKTPVRRREVSEAPEDVMKVLESFQAIIDKIDDAWIGDSTRRSRHDDGRIARGLVVVRWDKDLKTGGDARLLVIGRIGRGRPCKLREDQQAQEGEDLFHRWAPVALGVVKTSSYLARKGGAMISRNPRSPAYQA